MPQFSSEIAAGTFDDGDQKFLASHRFNPKTNRESGFLNVFLVFSLSLCILWEPNLRTAVGGESN